MVLYECDSFRARRGFVSSSVMVRAASSCVEFARVFSKSKACFAEFSIARGCSSNFARVLLIEHRTIETP